MGPKCVMCDESLPSTSSACTAPSTDCFLVTSLKIRSATFLIVCILSGTTWFTELTFGSLDKECVPLQPVALEIDAAWVL